MMKEPLMICVTLLLALGQHLLLSFAKLGMRDLMEILMLPLTQNGSNLRLKIFLMNFEPLLLQGLGFVGLMLMQHLTLL